MRALISVHDKTGLLPFAKGLVSLGWEIVSSGGTAKALREANISVRDVSEVTGFPEILDGRVKTLHPKIHAGILAKKNDPKHKETLKQHQIQAFDLVVVNLYPFEEAIRSQRSTVSEREKIALENIDIGGPTLIRAAAKNYEDVMIVVDPGDYGEVLDVIASSNSFVLPARPSFGGSPSKDEAISLKFRKQLATKAFARTAAYEQAIAGYFSPSFVRRGEGEVDIGLPHPCPPLTKGRGKYLRYGENPHQEAIFYPIEGQSLAWGEPLARGEPLQGKELSYNNILDATAAWHLIQEFTVSSIPPPLVGGGVGAGYVCVIIKHTNPCGVASSKNSLLEAFETAYGCDAESSFGGIVALNHEVDAEMARKMSELFLEVVLASAFSKEALEILSKKKNVRLLPLHPCTSVLKYQRTRVPRYEYRSAGGGLLVQTLDDIPDDPSEWKTVTKRKPTPAEMQALIFGWKVVKHVKSNAIVFATTDRTLGIGAGQTSRVDAVRVAQMKMKNVVLEYQSTIVLSSDAFFPFPDGVEEAAKAGATAVVQPGGSVRDKEVIAVADQLNLAMIFTNRRHFRH